MKRLLHKMQPILDELFDNGQGTRMELFERSGAPNWHDFKHHIGFLRVQGMIDIVPFTPGKEMRQLVFDLSADGHEFVHSLRG